MTRSCPLRSTLKRVLAALLVTVLVGCELAAAQMDAEPSYIDDRALQESFAEELTELLESGQAVEMSALRDQLDRGPVDIELPQKESSEMPLPELYRRCKDSVVIIGGLYWCDNCKEHHVSTMAGFALTDSGIIATAYHGVDRPKFKTMGAMTADGKVYVVKEVVAASRYDDVALLKLDGTTNQSRRRQINPAQEFVFDMMKLIQSQSWDTMKKEAKIWIADHPDNLSPVEAVAYKLVNTPNEEAQRMGGQLARQILTKKPDSKAAVHMPAWLAYKEERFEEAAKFNERLLALDPNSIRTMNDLAWIWSEEMGRSEEALKLAKKAIDILEPGDAAVPASAGKRFHLAQVYWDSGRQDEARELFRQCLDRQATVGGLDSEQIAEAKRRCERVPEED